MPRNLLPKFNHSSHITKNIRKHIENVLENPINIPCVVNGQVYKNNTSQQISSYDNTKVISNYSKITPKILQSNLNTFRNIQKDYSINFTPKQRIEVFENVQIF